MLTPDDFRRLALSLPEATESEHFHTPDFRVRGRIFATLWPGHGRGVVALTREQQEMLCDAEPAMFARIKGAMGAKGWTDVILAEADEITALSALTMAWRSRAPKRLVAAIDGAASATPPRP
ncbi:MAG: MmcQ/YjbR family DNA-binding protein [Bauldia sp.]|nr:MmcQ/YjbR family DNA-binding protein [Bauldia sp.]